jgi:aryl-alcohol dehydrogenase-like predicted oxidoreductase
VLTTVTFFDTAEIDGRKTDEELVGDAAPVPGEIWVSTRPARRSRSGLSEASPCISGGLLKTEPIDLFYPHRVDPNVPSGRRRRALDDFAQHSGKIDDLCSDSIRLNLRWAGAAS